MQTHGFELIREQVIPEINSLARLYRHEKTHAELLSISNDDPAKTFGVSFRTIPSDSTGVAHILEHIVLGGSEDYPVKEPFVELLKGSLAYFINALTFDDKTIYPVSSPNKQDFYNLIDVYLDAVFHPLLKQISFKQEGWHYSLSSPDQELKFHGVVFNEMKGQISNPDTILALKTQQSLMPETPYVHHAAGDPQFIPDLSYEDFLSFHKTHYHPSNALFYFYGDDPNEVRLEKIDKVIGTFERAKPTALIETQPPFDKPKVVRSGYPASDGLENKPMVGVSWLLPVNDDPEFALSTSILAHILMGTPASPIRKALTDSGLGEEVYGTGYGGDIELFSFLNQLSFTAGLKGVKPDAIEEIEPLIFSTLTSLVSDGIDPNALQASMNSVEFQLREANYGRLPRGIMYMVIALSFWNYARDPLALLAFAEPLQQLKTNLKQDQAIFENFIQRFMLDNPHRVTLQLIPDPDFHREREQAERQRLVTVRDSMDEAQVEALVITTSQLQKLQENPDRPEDLATLPVLHLDDLDPKAPTIPIKIIRKKDPTILYHDLPTLGITYLDLGFDLHTLETRQLQYVPLLGRALIEIGTEHEDTVQIAQRIGKETGGIESATFSSATRDSEGSQAYLFLRAKATMDKTDEMLSILQDLLLAPNLDQQRRFLQIVLEEKTRLESALIPAGHLVVDRRLRAGFDEAGWLQEQLQGTEYLMFLRQLAEQIETNWPSVLQALVEIMDKLCNRRTCICNLTLDSDGVEPIVAQLEDFLGILPSSAADINQWPLDLLEANEGFALPAQVNYVGMGAPLYDLGYQVDGSIHVIRQYLRLTYLWEKVRVLGGAYGVFPIFDPLSGGLTFISYRDPHTLKTVETFSASSNFLNELQITDRELVKAIISTIGSTDPYRLPDAQGFTSMARYLTDVTDEYRQSIRDQILGTTEQDFNAFGEVLEQAAERWRVVIMGSTEKLEEANAQRGGNWINIQSIL